MIPDVIPNGVAEFIVIVLVALFLAYLWWLDKFGSKKSNCALAEEKVKEILVRMEALSLARQELERQLLDVHKQSVEMNKLLLNVIQENTKANTLLAERMR